MLGAEITVPLFWLIKMVKNQKAIVDWGYNAWGNKYPPFDLDDVIPTKIGKEFDIPVSSRNCNGRWKRII